MSLEMVPHHRLHQFHQQFSMKSTDYHLINYQKLFRNSNYYDFLWHFFLVSILFIYRIPLVFSRFDSISPLKIDVLFYFEIEKFYFILCIVFQSRQLKQNRRISDKFFIENNCWFTAVSRDLIKFIFGPEYRSIAGI